MAEGLLDFLASQEDLDHAEGCLDAIKNPRYREFMIQAIEKAHAGDGRDLFLGQNFLTYPVTPEEFVCSPEFLDKGEDTWPRVLEAFCELNSGRYYEAVLTGGIGVAKTHLAILTNAYQLYWLLCLRSPHKLFGLDPTSEIELIFQSMTGILSKEVDYTRFKNVIDRAPYFKTNGYDKNYTSILKFKHNIYVKPVSGDQSAAIGQNVIGGLIDEMNFMEVIEKSRKTHDQQNYDQAIAIYDAISRRRKSRFMNQGQLPGILCLVSSKRYPGQFTDRKMEEARTDPGIYVYDKRTWDVKPEGSFSGEMFPLFIGSESEKPRIISDEKNDIPSSPELVVEVPVEYKADFQRDIMGSLRDIAGISTIARHPFITDPGSVARAMGKSLSIFSREDVDFVSTKLELYPKRFENPHLPRYAHVDLGATADSCGVAIGHVPRFVKIELTPGDEERRIKATYETLPVVRLDGILEVRPPVGGEIIFERVRNIFYILRDQLKLNIKWISFDTWQSRDSLQLMRARGFNVGTISTDVRQPEVTQNVSRKSLTNPYDFAKAAFMDGRVELPYHAKTLKEFAALERDVKEERIDHPPGGSKDCSDAVACVIYGLTMSREIWVLNKVPIVEIPATIRAPAKPDTAPTPEEAIYQRIHERSNLTEARVRGDDVGNRRLN